MGPSSPKQGVYHISRAAQKNGRFAAEFYLEYIFGLNGVHVIRPEALSIEEQLRIYTTARKMIFAEGSALHTLQLLGRELGEVYVLKRRPGGGLAKSLLEPRCRSVKYYDCGRFVTGLNRKGKPARALGINVPNATDVEAFFSSVGVTMKGWSASLYQENIAADVLLWAAEEKEGRRKNIPGSLEFIARQLAELGYG